MSKRQSRTAALYSRCASEWIKGPKSGNRKRSRRPTSRKSSRHGQGVISRKLGRLLACLQSLDNEYWRLYRIYARGTSELRCRLEEPLSAAKQEADRRCQACSELLTFLSSATATHQGLRSREATPLGLQLADAEHKLKARPRLLSLEELRLESEQQQACGAEDSLEIQMPAKAAAPVTAKRGRAVRS